MSERELAQDFLDVLEPRPRQSVRMRFGLDGQSPMTYAGIAAEYGISVTAAQQEVQRALQKMRKAQMLRDDHGAVLQRMDDKARTAWEHHMGWSGEPPCGWREVVRRTGITNAHFVAWEGYRRAWVGFMYGEEP